MEVIFENKTRNVEWHLPIRHDAIKAFDVKPGSDIVFEIGENNLLYEPYSKITATQSRTQEETYDFAVSLTPRKHWKPSYEDPEKFWTIFKNSTSQLSGIQRWLISEDLIIGVPFGIPLKISLPIANRFTDYEVIDKIERGRKVIEDGGTRRLDVKTETKHVKRSDPELKRLFALRRMMKMEYISQEMLGHI